MNTLNYTNEQIIVSLGCTVTLYFYLFWHLKLHIAYTVARKRCKALQCARFFYMKLLLPVEVLHVLAVFCRVHSRCIDGIHRTDVHRLGSLDCMT